MSKLEVSEVTKRYGRSKVLQKVSFCVEEGSCVGIMGESGSGKSTVARLLTGLETHSEGDLFYEGRSYSKMTKAEERDRNRRVQMVFQNSSGAVNPNFSVGDVLFEPLNICYGKKMSKEEKTRRAQEYLAGVGLEKIALSQKARQLSGGQLQRVCIARALMTEPSVLVLDESLSGLDPLVQQKMLKLLGDLKSRFNLTYVFIAHDFMTCYYLCDKIIVMDGGRIIETLENIGEEIRVRHPLTKRLLGDAGKYLRLKDETQ
ncbi:MAG: dipeptide/oligopeptide/nickel ABC transporter ATP-binding protein [Filifactor alocis]|nr:dipeptide/oligopeptide/nickel ABC transporter ATP-binding protein [Filifactor alocis]